MNILINCSNLKVGGGLQVAHSFINSLYNYSDHSFVVVSSTMLYEQLKCDIPVANIRIEQYDIPSSLTQSLKSNDDFLDGLVRIHKVNAVFSIFGPSYWRPKVKHITGYAKPHYIYIDSPFFKQISFLSQIKLKLKKLVQLHDFNKNSDVLISENEDVSSKLKVLFKNKEIHTVTNYYNQVFDSPKEWIDDLPISSFDGFTLLTISANYPHKNLKIIPKVVKYLKKVYPRFKFRFVLTITSESLVTEVSDSIVFLGKVKVNQCPPLYNIADAVFLPTLLECFTATYPEAMRMSKPILTSNLNFAKGLCGKSAVYFDPLNVASIGDCIYNLSRNKDLIGELIMEGKNQLKQYDSYQDRADKYIEIITN